MTNEENGTKPKRRKIGPPQPVHTRQPYDFLRRAGGVLAPRASVYVEVGWRIVPVDVQTRKVALADGTTGATADASTISRWVAEGYALGIATGRVSNLVAVRSKGDLGHRTWADLTGRHASVQTTEAGSNGKYFFFLAPDELLLSREEVAPGLDFLGEGGVFVPRKDCWRLNGRTPVPLPDWLADLAAGRTAYEPPPPPEQPPARPPAHPIFSSAETAASDSREVPRTSQPKPARKVPAARDATTGAPKKERPGKDPAPRLTYAEALAGVQGANRNDMVFRLACRLHQDGAEFDEALLFAKVAAAHCEPPLPEDEAVRCVENAWRYDPPLAISDLGLAERFVARHADMVRHVEEQDRWLVWAGHWWEGNRRAFSKMTWGTVRSLRDEAKAEKDSTRKRTLFAFSRKAENEEARQRMLALASAELSVRAADLDRPGLVAFADGVLDLSEGTFRPGRREDLLTKHADFPYDPDDQRCQDWVARQGGRRSRQPGGTVAPATPTRQALATAEADGWQEKFDRWLAERCELGSDYETKAKVLHDDFCTWSGERVTDRRFGELVRAKGFGVRKSSVFVYKGLRLRQ